MPEIQDMFTERPALPPVVYCLAFGHRWVDAMPGITGRVCVRCGLRPSEVDEDGFPLDEDDAREEGDQ